MTEAEPIGSDPASQPHAPRSLYAISIPALGIIFDADGRVNLLQAMIAAGHKGIAVGCRGGGCGVCRIRILEGSFVAQSMSRQRISPEDEGKGIVLACRIAPRSALVVEPMPVASDYARVSWRPPS